MIKMMRKARTGLLLSGFAGLMLAAGSGSVFAQTCTISNWQVNSSPGAVGLTEGNVGLPNDSFSGVPFRRYGGPCGLRVPVDGTARYLSDGSPVDEAAYNARFYVFLDSAGSENVRLFEAVNTAAGGNALEVWYEPGASKIVLKVATTDGPANLEITGIGSGWHSVEFAWAAGETATVSLAVNVEIDTADPDDFASATLNTSGQSIGEARLGNINGANSAAAFIDFDDFDSRRVSTPGRLCRGLTVDESERDFLSSQDITSIAIEIATNGATPAGGQPDRNEDGVVTSADITGIAIAIGTNSNDCNSTANR